MTTPELPPLPSWSVEGEKIADDGRYVHLYDGDDVEDRDAVREARERILLDRIRELERLWQSAEARYAEADAAAMAHAKRIRELEADAGRYRVALVDCMEWMESGRASTDWGFWDWQEGDVYTRAKAAMLAAREDK